MQGLHKSLPTSAYRDPLGHEYDHDLQQARLRDDVDTLRAYNALISRHDVIRKQLVAHRNEVERRVQRRRHYLSSIRKVPPEIWADIFALLCFSENDDTWPVREHYPTQPSYAVRISEFRDMIPQTLSHVCAQWRDVAIHHRMLWTRISVDLAVFLQSHVVPFQNRALEAFRTVLKRSGAMPLHLRLESYSLEQNSQYQLPRPLREVFEQAFVRTMSIDTTVDLFQQVDFAGATSFPALRYAVLESHRLLVPLERYSREQVHALLAAPNLNNIFVGTIRWLAALAPFPFRNVTTFACHAAFTKSDLRQIHQACPRLEDLNIRVNWLSIVDAESDVLTFSFLRNLVLQYDGWSPTPVLNHLIAPSLISIVHDSSVYGRDMIEAFLYFVERSNCALRMICFRVDFICVVDEARTLWDRLIDIATTLESFEISVLTSDVTQSKRVVDELLSLLKPLPPATPYAPLRNLETFSVTIEQGTFQPEDGSVLQSILHAFASVGRLRTTGHSSAPVDSLALASLSIQFRSWENNSPGHTAFALLCEESGFDEARLLEEAKNLTVNGLEIVLEVDGRVLFSSPLYQQSHSRFATTS
ncbi:hypothetical protein AAF712_015884 [Marasmius tenuissimus]|uniref:F-box domain-containing protein n=1 Tax=Marasmius tenuissimus TaxID=585030 RepID=A0ABR2Z8A4_9AGAR